jgi:hypothetical protein
MLKTVLAEFNEEGEVLRFEIHKLIHSFWNNEEWRDQWILL